MEDIRDVEVGSLVANKRNLVAVGTDDTLDKALGTMQGHNILGVAVISRDGIGNVGEGGVPEGLVGVLTLSDVMSVVAFHSFKLDAPEPSDFEAFQSLGLKAGDICTASIHSEDERVWAFDATTKIGALLEYMCKGVHRGIISFDLDGKTHYRMVTQTDLIGLLYCHPSTVSHKLWGQTVGETFSDIKEPFVVDHKWTALQAYRRMHQNHCQAAPVVDDDGVAIASISASDLRNLRAGNLKLVLSPVVHFLKQARLRGIRTCMPGTRPPVTCTVGDTLQSVVMKLITQKIHRVWVVNDANKPIGTVSMTDILREFYRDTL